MPNDDIKSSRSFKTAFYFQSLCPGDIILPYILKVASNSIIKSVHIKTVYGNEGFEHI